MGTRSLSQATTGGISKPQNTTQEVKKLTKHFTCLVLNSTKMKFQLTNPHELIHYNQPRYQPKTTTLTCVLVQMVELEPICQIIFLTHFLVHHIDTSNRHSVLTNTTRLMSVYATRGHKVQV